MHKGGFPEKKMLFFWILSKFPFPAPAAAPLPLGQNKKKTAVFSPETFPKPVTLQMERVGQKYFLSFHSFS